MDFELSREQQLLKENLHRFLQRHSGDARRSATAPGRDTASDVWTALATKLGILGLGVPESRGGSEGGAVEQMIVVEALGEHLMLEPFIDANVICLRLLDGAATPAAQQAASMLIAGDAVTAFAWAEPRMRYDPSDITLSAIRHGDGWRLSGAKSIVNAAPLASSFIVAARTGGSEGHREGLSLFLVDRDAPYLEMTGYRTVDGRAAADLQFSAVEVGERALLGRTDESWPLIDEVCDRAVAALCAEAVGVLRRLLRDTINYTQQRRQFGQALADFQVLQHRMVDMSIKLEMASAASILATLKLEAAAAERARAVSAAKVIVGEACRFIGQNAIQLHGGMGMTDDLPVGRAFKRAIAIDAELGDEDYHIARYGRAAPGRRFA